MSRIHLLVGAKRIESDGKESEVCFTLAELPILEDALAEVADCRLIVIDPIGSFLGGRTDAHRDNEVRSVLAPLSMLAERVGAAVVIVAHRRKSTGGGADDAALGSRAFTGLARAVWHLSRDSDDHRRRLFLPGKNNLAAEPDGLAFTIFGEPASVHWEKDPVAMTADDAMDRERQSNDGEQNATQEAVEWLRGTLEKGKRLAKEVKDLARRDGIAVRTIERAAGQLKVERGRDGFLGPWVWSLPAEDESSDSPVPANDSCTRQGSELGENDSLWRERGVI